MNATYAPQRGSLPHKVITFLLQNPDEELTRADVAIKFDASASQIDSQLNLAVQKGVLKKAKNNEAESVWILGNAGAVAVGDSQPAAQPESPSESLSALPWKPIFEFDPATIPLEDDVPIFRPRGNAYGQPNWSELLQRMRPGQSCVLPKNKRHAIAKVVQEVHKNKTGRYVTAVLPDKQSFRLWRVE